MGRPKKVISKPSKVKADAPVEPVAEKVTAATVPAVEVVAAPVEVAAPVVKAVKEVPKSDAQLNREMIAETLKDVIPMAVMAGAQMNRPAQVISTRGPTCSVCQQPNMACKGKHAKMVVLPRGGRAAKFFQGCILNGATYLSSNRSHAIVVPFDNDFVRQLEQAEMAEDRFHEGKTYEHNSGSMSRGFVPALGPLTDV